jgi:Fur family transcriptional regulator, peroxide stress response regulator
MAHSYKELSGKLEQNRIKPTLQRIKVLEYLINNPCHPTVEQIYNDLYTDIPTLSKTTVYNTLNLFLEKGLIKLLNIEDNETRFDIMTELHGHFKCDQCGCISNFGINIDKLEPGELAGYQVKDKNVYFKGLCPKCLANINDK